MKDPEYTIRRCIDGDIWAFRDLVEAFRPFAYGLAFRILFNEEDAKDVVQETFIRVWKHLHRFDPRNRFTTWLYPIVTRLSYDRLKAKKRHRRKMNAIQSENEERNRDGEDAMKRVEQAEMMNMIEKAAKKLHPKQRIVFTLRDLQGLSIEETATAAGMSRGAVKSSLYYARRRIREELEKHGYGGVERDEMQ